VERVDDFQPLPHSVRTLWLGASAAIGLGVAAVGVAADLAAREAWDISTFVPPAVIGVLLGALVGLVGALVADATWQRWGFQLTDQWIRVRHGVLNHREAVIPRNRVQTVSSENGPLDRLLGLTSVTVHSAGLGSPNIDIPHLDDVTVEWLRDELGRGVGA
jgi:membrane protein YdbS with pleckstrin-like domain